MKNIKKYGIALGFAALISACEQYELPEVAAPTLGTSEINLSKFVSVGNSLTAGFMDGALYKASQESSFPAIMAKQFSLVGGGTFNQPTITSENGCSNPTGGCTQGRLVLRNTACDGVPPTDPTYAQKVSTAPAPTATSGGLGIFAFSGDKAALNNFGVPGVTLGSSLSPALAASPYYNRIASAPGTSTLIGDAARALTNNGTFFTFWLGNNDILGYATSGATGSFTPADNSPTGFGTLFNAALGAMLAAKADAKGAVANIPDVTSIPYFSTINPLAFTVPFCSRAALGVGIDQLNAAITGWNAGVNANPALTAAQKAALVRPTLSKNFTAYPLIIFDASLSDASVPTPNGTLVIPKIRNMVAADNILITLTAGSDPAGFAAGMGISPANPIVESIHDKFTLTPAEQTEIRNVVSQYNTIIANAVAANSSRLVLVDTNAALTAIKGGRVAVGGVSLTASLVPPFGAFSTDGVHPNPRGSAYIANVFIEAINAKWSATIPLANPNDYLGNSLPFNQ